VQRELREAVVRHSRRIAEEQNAVRARQQAAVAELGQVALQPNTPLQHLLDEAAALVAKTLEVEFAAVFELQRDGERFVVRAGVGWRTGVLGIETIGTGLTSQAGYTLARNAPVVVEDISKEERFNTAPLLAQHEVAGGLSVPIAGTPQPFGVLAAHTRRNRAFNENDIHFLQAAASMISTAIARQRAEEELRQSHERFELAMQGANDGLWDWNMETNEAFLSPRFKTILGYEDDEMANRYESWSGRLHPDDRENALQLVQDCLDGKVRIFELEHRLQHKDGSWRWMLARGTVHCRPDGRPWRMVASSRDITERKRAADLARESAERFRLLVEGVKDYAFIMLDPHGKVANWNAGGERLSGYTEADILGRHFAVFYPEEEVAQGRADMHLQIAAQVGSIEDEGWSVRQDDSRFWANIALTALRSRDGTLRGFAFVVHDVSERSRAEATLRRSEEKYRSLVANIPDVTWTADDAGRLTYISPNVERVLGFSEEEMGHGVESQHWFGRVHPDDAQRVRAAYTALFERGEPFNVEFRFQRKDDTWIWIQNRAVSTHESEGAILADGLLRDVTEEKLAQQKISEQASLLNLAQDAITVRDMEGRILYWNKGAERLFGWTAPEAIGARVTDLFDKQTKDLDTAVEGVLARGEWSGELRKENKAGKAVIVNSRWTLLRDAQDQPKSILAINTDLTEKKQLESQFLRAQRMDSIGTLAGGVAHDLNNILAPILMSSTLLRAGLPPHEMERLVDTIETSAQRGSAIVKQLLAFGRGVEGERVIVQLRHLVNEMATMARETFPKNITLSTKIPKDLWSLRADPTHLHQVLLNLAVNARDAMPHGGTITLKAENVTLDEVFTSMEHGTKPGPYVLLQAIDTGTGIPIEIIDKIFDPFFTTKDPGKGTGLGLSTVLGIVKSHCGFIQVHSEAGKGTAFKIYLPATPAPMAKGPAMPASELPHGNQELVLVVDDELPVRETAEKLLQRSGYRVLTASDGVEALALFSQHRAEINGVITDVMMPHMDGVGLTRVLRRMAPQLPIVASTGLDEDDKMEELKALGVRAYLAKPYSVEKLLTVLRDALAAK
ncbi:MAG: PAS domain S-box protein, partial [Verrucomicrobia bacterium]|nr:PAS domain S-box protein [Verrucomicrobiota bacterium]